MNAAVVKLNTLSDSVGASAQNHNLRLFRADRILIRCVVGGIVVGIVLGSADMNALPCFLYAQLNPAIADGILGNCKQLA